MRTRAQDDADYGDGASLGLTVNVHVRAETTVEVTTYPEAGRATTWVLQGRNSRGFAGRVALRRLVTSRKSQFRWRGPEGNPYILREEERNTFESRYADLVFAFSNT